MQVASYCADLSNIKCHKSFVGEDAVHFDDQQPIADMLASELANHS